MTNDKITINDLKMHPRVVTPYGMADSTYVQSTRKMEDITLDDLVRTKELLKSIVPPYKRIEMCKKHWKLISKQLTKAEDVEDRFMPNFATGFLGIQVVVKPYLKKVRMYR